VTPKGIIAGDDRSRTPSALNPAREISACYFWSAKNATSAGALAAAKISRGLAFQSLMERPTENRLALGSKGSLRYQINRRAGRMAAFPPIPNSANPPSKNCSMSWPNCGRMPMPSDPLLGASTLNIGVIEGGPAAPPNVIPDHGPRGKY